jgi:hypothetical protein
VSLYCSKTTLIRNTLDASPFSSVSLSSSPSLSSASVSR